MRNVLTLEDSIVKYVYLNTIAFTYDIYISVIAGVLLQGVKRSVMVNTRLIREVVVVTYNTDEVHISRNI